MQECLHQQLDDYNRKQKNKYQQSWGTALQFMEGSTQIIGKQYDETHFAKAFEKHDQCRLEKQLKI